ncbi:MAG: biotin/lipoyl-containing protein [Ekhidna sp.]
MIEVKVGDSSKVGVSSKKDKLFINDQLFDGEVVKINENTLKVFKENMIYRVEIVDLLGKEMKLKVNDHLLDIKVTDHIDRILNKLGMNVAASTSVKDVKAPMPGSILNILITEGVEVKQGDQLLVLEAMKMENVIKSPGEGKVDKIHVAEKENVEKNQVLISFE